MTITIKFYIEAAKARGWGVEWIDVERHVLMLHPPNEEPIIIRNNVTELSSAIGYWVSNYKSVASVFAAKVGFQVPKAVVIEGFEQCDKALPLLQEVGRVVVKPMDAAFGDGISMHVTTAEKLERAVEFARKHNVKSEAILVQEFCEGRDYRILLLNGKVIAAIERVPLLVVGDGVHTIAELLEAKIAEIQAHEASQIKQVELNAQEILAQLSDHTPDQVLTADEPLRVQGVANLSKGGEAVDVTDEVHPEIIAKSAALAQLLQMGICAVDVLSADISKSPDEAQTTFIELNASPGIRGHYFPAIGQRRKVVDMILDAILEKRHKEAR